MHMIRTMNFTSTEEIENGRREEVRVPRSRAVSLFRAYALHFDSVKRSAGRADGEIIVLVYSLRDKRVG